MNKPISRFPCGDMGLQAGGGRNSNPYGGFWQDAHGDRSLDAVGPVRVTGRLGHGYALHTNRDPYPEPFDPEGVGISAGDTFSVEHNRGLETVGVGDPEVDYFLPTGFVLRAHLSIDRMPVVGDLDYDGSYYPGGGILSFFNQVIGVNSTGHVTLKANDGTNVVTEAAVGLNEYHLYEIYVEFRHAADDRTTTVAIRIDEEVVAQVCVTTLTYESVGSLDATFHSYSTGITVDDIGIDAITSGIGHWIGPGECAIIRPAAPVSRPLQSWASGTDNSPENGDGAPFDPLHPQCFPGVLPDWQEALAFEIPYHPVNWTSEEGFIGGYGADFAIGYMMSNPGGDPVSWEGTTRATCGSIRRPASGEQLIMTLDTPVFTPNFSRTFVYAQRAGHYRGIFDIDTDPTGGAGEKLINHLETNAGYAGVLDFGNEDGEAWVFSTQYLDSDAEDLNLVIRREINYPSIGVNVYAAGSQVALDPTPGPDLPVCTPVVDTAGPIICFV